ncbi:MAG: MoxR family ATPase [Lachnospiraceae bacterium]|nr:MoxR family ATPase [Lachnospiraceae bacterium]
MYDKTVQIQNEVKKAIVGKDDVISKALMAILAQGHVLLEDVPGVGKTTLATAFARTLGLDTKRVQFTSDTMPSDIIGFSAYDMKTGELQYKPGAIMTNLLLADEINRTSSKTQSALLEAMEERQVTVDGVTRALEAPFIVLATQNPVGSAGTQLLPSAQLDRFLMRLSMGYPDRASQVEIMKGRHHANPLDAIQPVLDIPVLLKLIDQVTEVHVEDRIYDYVSDLVEQTRNNTYIQLGISPRGALAVCRTAKACAFLKGRDYVIPDDVAEIFICVCAHRLVLTPKARLHEQTAESLLADILNKVKKPDVKESVIR